MGGSRGKICDFEKKKKKEETNNEFLKKDYGERQDEVISFAEWSSVAKWGLSKISPGEKRVWAFQSSECRTLLEKIHKLEMGQCLCQTNMQKRVIKKGQDLALNFYPELHKDYNSNRMKM